MRKSPTGGKAGSGSDGCVEVREEAALERTDSEIGPRLGSDHLRKRCIVIITASFRARYGWKAPVGVRTKDWTQETRKGKKTRGVQRGEHEELVEGRKSRSERLTGIRCRRDLVA